MRAHPEWTLTPLHIMILIHWHCTNKPYAEHEPEHANSPAVIDYTNHLLDEGMIKVWEKGFTTTDRGKAHITKFCKLPLPIQSWT